MIVSVVGSFSSIPPGLSLISQRNHLQHQYSKLFCYANINVLFMHLSPIGVLTEKNLMIKYYNMTWTKEMKIISLVRPM